MFDMLLLGLISLFRETIGTDLTVQCMFFFFFFTLCHTHLFLIGGCTDHSKSQSLQILPPCQGHLKMELFSVFL